MPLARRNFPGIQRDVLEKWLGWVLVEIATGKVDNGWSSADSSGQKWIDMNLPPERRRDLILQDLSILVPDVYPPADISPVTRTVPGYIT